MNKKKFGHTDLYISEFGFGAWGIGGNSYGPVEERDAINGLSSAEDCGCNFIDTAKVYGRSEEIVGKFLKTRRSKWILSSKYSGQDEGITKTVEGQLKTLKTDCIDFYQIHWMPEKDSDLFEKLESLKASGKIRYAGVSLYNKDEIRLALKNSVIDGFQVACNLLEPDPYVSSLKQIEQAGKGVLIRSPLKGGLLSGSYDQSSRFNDKLDQRSEISQDELDRIFTNATEFQFLLDRHETLLHAAARYPLAYKTSSCTLLGTKNPSQARINFCDIPAKSLTPAELVQIEATQKRLKLHARNGIAGLLKSIRNRILG